MEYFHGHAHIEHTLFDGALTPVAGNLIPDRSRPGPGPDFKRADVAVIRVSGEEAGEIPKAFVVLKGEIAPEDILG